MARPTWRAKVEVARTIAGAAVLATAGCAGLDFYTPVHNYQPELRQTTEPAVNEERHAGVGDDLLFQARALFRETLYVPEQLAISLYTITPGHFRKVGQTEKGEYFFPAGGSDGGTILQRDMSDPPQALFVFAKTGILCVVAITNLIGCDRPKANVTFASADGYERRRRAETSEGDTWRQALSFNGKDGHRVKLVYREAAVGTPTVSSEVAYDLAASPIIEYRGARIEVLDATPRSIRYRVLQPLRAPR